MIDTLQYHLITGITKHADCILRSGMATLNCTNQVWVPIWKIASATNTSSWTDNYNFVCVCVCVCNKTALPLYTNSSNDGYQESTFLKVPVWCLVKKDQNSKHFIALQINKRKTFSRSQSMLPIQDARAPTTHTHTHTQRERGEACTCAHTENACHFPNTHQLQC